MRDPYLYPNTDVLKNKADIRDRKLLERMEGDLTVMRLAELASGCSINRFDFASLCQVHYHIFHDIYDWAGKPRIINITKSEPVLSGLSIEYSDCFDIAKDARLILNDMNAFPWQNASFDSVVKNYSHYMAGLWKVHPFREGNTRSIITFCNYFMMSKGYTIDINLYKDNAQYVRNALVAASATFSDLGDKRKPKYLERLVADSLKDGWKELRDNSILEKLKNNQDKIKSQRQNVSSESKKIQITRDDEKSR